MKDTSYFQNTLCPVRRVAAFLLFLAALCLVSCKNEDEASAQNFMDAQADAYGQMTSALALISEGKGSPETIASLEQGAVQFRESKRELLTHLKKSQESELPDDSRLQSAQQEYFETLKRYQESGNATAETEGALRSIHESAPVIGEGSLK